MPVRWSAWLGTSGWIVGWQLGEWACGEKDADKDEQKEAVVEEKELPELPCGHRG